MEHEIVYGLWDGKEVGGEPQCELSAKTSSAAAWTENDANPTTALSATRERPSAGAPRPGVVVQTLRAAEPRERRPWWTHAVAAAEDSLGRPRRGSAPARGGWRPPERTVFQIPTGWTVFEIPSTPRSILSVQCVLCGWDNFEIAYYFTSFFPSLAIQARG